MVGARGENGRKEGVALSWRPKVALQMWAGDPCPPFPRKLRQPGVRPPPPVSTKRELSGQHSPAAPSLYQQRAQEQAWRPSKVASHSARDVKGSWREKTAESSARPPQRAGQGLARRNSSEGGSDDEARRRHRSALASLLPSTLCACPAAPRMPLHLRSAPGLSGGAKRQGRTFALATQLSQFPRAWRERGRET
jgi:hypothetical protein